MTLSLKFWAKGGLILTMVSLAMYCMFQVLPPNLLLVYQMTHTGSPKKVIFSPVEVEITEISSGKFIAKGVANHTSKVYMFSHFLPYSNPSALLFHANEERKIWKEIFGHLNYKYLSDS